MADVGSFFKNAGEAGKKLGSEIAGGARAAKAAISDERDDGARLKRFARVGGDLFASGAVTSNGGNLSETDGVRIWITRTGSALGHLERGDVITTGWDPNTADADCSVELLVHRAIYHAIWDALDMDADATPGVTDDETRVQLAVAHAHTLHTTARSFVEDEIAPLSSEAQHYFAQPVPVIAPEQTIASDEVARETARLMGAGARVVVVRGHGPFAVAQTLEEAYKLISVLEHNCQLRNSPESIRSAMANRKKTPTSNPTAAQRPAAARPTAALPPRSAFLPVSRADMDARGWDECDFVYICGDAYVDHSSFGMAIISRVLEAAGYRVGIICQPDWRDPASIAALGRPRLGFLVSAGNMDSMVNHYTVAKRRRSRDNYSPGGETGLRPDHATVVYGQLIRRTYKDVPVIIGGVEASLRRLAHYDYWSDKLKRSVLLDSGADILVYGMGERTIVEVADALAAGIAADQITWIPGTVYRSKDAAGLDERTVHLPSWEALCADKLEYARSFRTQYLNLDPFKGRPLVEAYERDGLFVVQNPAAEPLGTAELDAVYRLPYARSWHPDYAAAGGVPTLAEVQFSLTSARGCFGECAFCSLAFHQGRIIQARSHESLLDEARLLTQDPGFKGYIHDVGGPTANFRQPACAKQSDKGACPGKRCLSPRPCTSLHADHSDYLALLRELRELPGVKKVFVRSGLRFDYVLLDKHGDEFIEELAAHHVSGQLRLAPEHVSDAVLKVMGKPPRALYERFVQRFDEASAKAGKEQFVLPYLMSSHPGSTLREAIELAEFCRDMGFNPEQVSDFYPTPSTISTCIYYTGVDPRTMEPVYCARSPHEKAMQRALIQYRNPANRALVIEALERAGRRDLIGFGPKCLVRPSKEDASRTEKSRGGGGQRADKDTKQNPRSDRGSTKRGRSAR